MIDIMLHRPPPQKNIGRAVPRRHVRLFDTLTRSNCLPIVCQLFRGQTPRVPSIKDHTHTHTHEQHALNIARIHFGNYSNWFDKYTNTLTHSSYLRRVQNATRRETLIQMRIIIALFLNKPP